MFKGVTSTGFEYELDGSITDDWEIIELLEDIDNNNPLAIVKLAKRILGNEQYARMKEHLRGDDGKVSNTAMSNALLEILNSNSNTKN